MQTIYFILVLALSNGDSIGLAAYDTRADCEAMAVYLQGELRAGAVAYCESE